MSQFSKKLKKLSSILETDYLSSDINLVILELVTEDKCWGNLDSIVSNYLNVTQQDPTLTNVVLEIPSEGSALILDYFTEDKDPSKVRDLIPDSLTDETIQSIIEFVDAKLEESSTVLVCTDINFGLDYISITLKVGEQIEE